MRLGPAAAETGGRRVDRRREAHSGWEQEPRRRKVWRIESVVMVEVGRSRSSRRSRRRCLQVRRKHRHTQRPEEIGRIERLFQTERIVVVTGQTGQCGVMM